MDKSEHAQIRISKLENNIVEYKKAIENYRTDAIRYKRYFTILSKKIDIEICKECDGVGGFEWGDKYGNYDCEPCKKCGASGIIKKK